jgi:serine/threonine protein kinase
MFDLNHKIGEGSFSQVYQGTDFIKNIPVAVKRVRVGDIRSKIATRLLECEISILKIVDHPNIIKCLDIHTSINNCYIIMELCEEGDLDTELKKKKIFP